MILVYEFQGFALAGSIKTSLYSFFLLLTDSFNNLWNNDNGQQSQFLHPLNGYTYFPFFLSFHCSTPSNPGNIKGFSSQDQITRNWTLNSSANPWPALQSR